MHESMTRCALLYLAFNFRKGVLPIEAEFQPDSSTSFIDVKQTEEVVLKTKEIKDYIHHTAKGNTAKVQMKYKNDYDKNRGMGRQASTTNNHKHCIMLIPCCSHCNQGH